MLTKVEEVRKILAAHQAQADVGDNIEISMSSITQAVFKEEIRHYQEQLNSIISIAEQATHPEGKLKETFIQLCASRWALINNSSLSYVAFADSKTNILFWQLAVSLFEPKSLGQICAILMPETNVVQLGFSQKDTSKKKSLNNLKVVFEVGEAVSLFDEALQSHERLKRVVMVDNHLFDLETIANFQFKQHQLFFQAIYGFMPKLAQAIYAHNHELQRLNQDLRLISKNGLCLGEKLISIAEQLRQGGETLTGRSEASIGAQRATQELFDYISSLPDDFQQQVVVLKTGGNGGLGTLASVITHLKQGHCVEQAADALIQITKQAENECVLIKSPLLSEPDINNIKSRYNSAIQTLELNKGVNYSSGSLPWFLLEPILSEIHLESAEQYILALTSLPIAFYTPFIRGVKDTGRNIDIYINILRSNMLSTEQIHAFVLAMYTQIPSVINNNYLFMKILKVIPDNLKIEFISGLEDFFVKVLVKDTTELAPTLSVLGEGASVKLVEKISIPYLKQIIVDGTQLADVLSLLQKDFSIKLIKNLDFLYLKKIIKTPKSLNFLLSSYPEHFISNFIEKLSEDEIRIVIKDGDELYEVLDGLDKALKMEIICSLTDQVFRLIFTSSEELGRVLSLIPQDNWNSIINKLGNECLLMIIQDGTKIVDILEKIDQKERLDLLYLLPPQLIEKKVEEVSALASILEVLPLSDRKDFIEFLNKDYLNQLIEAGYQLQMILERLPEHYLLKFIEKLADCISENLKSTYDVNTIFSSEIKDYHFELMHFMSDELLEESKSHLKNKVQLMYFFESETRHRLYTKGLPKINSSASQVSMRSWALTCLVAAPSHFTHSFIWHQQPIIPELYNKMYNASEALDVETIAEILVKFINAHKLSHGQPSYAVLLHMCKELKLEMTYKKDDKTNQYYLIAKLNPMPELNMGFRLGCN